MKKSYLWSLLAVMMATLMSIGMTSCGDDDEVKPGSEQGGKTNEPEDNLPESSRAFVGAWVDNSENHQFFFFGDGTCKHYYYNSRNSSWPSGGEGFWTYDETTKILATTIGNWQWQVTLSNDQAWAGISLGANDAYSFQRDDASYIYALLDGISWVSEDESLTCYYSSDGSQSSVNFYIDSYSRYSSSSVTFEDSKVIIEVYYARYYSSNRLWWGTDTSSFMTITGYNQSKKTFNSDATLQHYHTTYTLAKE